MLSALTLLPSSFLPSSQPYWGPFQFRNLMSAASSRNGTKNEALNFLQFYFSEAADLFPKRNRTDIESKNKIHCLQRRTEREWRKPQRTKVVIMEQNFVVTFKLGHGNLERALEHGSPMEPWGKAREGNWDREILRVCRHVISGGNTNLLLCRFSRHLFSRSPPNFPHAFFLLGNFSFPCSQDEFLLSLCVPSCSP